LRRWVAQAEADDGARPGVTTAEADEIRQLKAENKRLREANEILRPPRFSSWENSTPAPADHGFIEQMRARGVAVESVCHVLREQGVQVAARTYRACKAARPPGRVWLRHLTPRRRRDRRDPSSACG